MFDYQAGEKYRLTLIMVALAGVMGGIFFTLILMPTPAPERKVAYQKWMSDPDITGGAHAQSAAGSGQAVASESSEPSAPGSGTDPNSAKEMIEQWLPLAWDLSAGSANQSQEKAISFMTPEVANTYRQNVWTQDLAKQIDASGVKSSFKAYNVYSGGKADGSAVVFVDGMQTLNIPGKGETTRPVKLEYMVRMLPEGLKIVGISEGGQKSS